jgi:hypothetical protein
MIAGAAIELELDLGPFERGLERARAMLAEVEKLRAESLPPLIVGSGKYLSREQLARLQHGVTEGLKTGKPVFCEGDMTFYQLVDGQWVPLDRAPARSLTITIESSEAGRDVDWCRASFGDSIDCAYGEGAGIDLAIGQLVRVYGPDHGITIRYPSRSGE